MVADRHSFIAACGNALAAQGLRVLIGDVLAPPDAQLAALKGNRMAAAAAVAREVARVIGQAAGEPPAPPPPRKPRRPAGCLF